MNTLFCFGLGYTALRLGRVLIANGWKIFGTTRDEAKRKQLALEGITAFLFTEEASLSSLQRDAVLASSHILYSIPPSAPEPVYYNYLKEIKSHPNLQWFGYLSTTGVYGDHGGAWVDENSQCKPTQQRSINRRNAELKWMETLPSTHIFRLSGIYGPGRNALLTVKEENSQRIEKPDHFFSRIHVDDIVQILTASMRNPNPYSIYNCADDLPSSSAEVLGYASELLKIPPPAITAFEDAILSPIQRSFYLENKRVKNEKIKKELGIKLLHPDYKAGLKSLLGRED